MEPEYHYFASSVLHWRTNKDIREMIAGLRAGYQVGLDRVTIII